MSLGWGGMGGRSVVARDVLHWVDGDVELDRSSCDVTVGLRSCRRRYVEISSVCLQ